jgi:hypothetical protein
LAGIPGEKIAQGPCVGRLAGGRSADQDQVDQSRRIASSAVLLTAPARSPSTGGGSAPAVGGCGGHRGTVYAREKTHYRELFVPVVGLQHVVIPYIKWPG